MPPGHQIQIFDNSHCGQRRSPLVAKIEIGDPVWTKRYASLKAIRTKRDIREWFYRTPKDKYDPRVEQFYETLREQTEIDDFIGVMATPNRKSQKGRTIQGKKQPFTVVHIRGKVCRVVYAEGKEFTELLEPRKRTNHREPILAAKTADFKHWRF